MTVSPALTGVHPSRVVEGGSLVITGAGLPVDDAAVTIGGAPARAAFGSPSRIVVTVPPGLPGGRAAVRVSGLSAASAVVEVGTLAATGLHQVDNPVFDAQGNLFVTYSGSRGQECPVSVFRVTPAGNREPFLSGIVNATSMTMGPDGLLYVSSRFDGAVYRVDAQGIYERVAHELGVACGITFDGSGALYVGDRSGTVFRVIDREAAPFASLPASVAAFHLAMNARGDLFVSGPTLGTYDQVYRVDQTGVVDALETPFGRPQGLAFGPDGSLYVAEALAGSSGIYRLGTHGADLIVSGDGLVGLAFGPSGELAVASRDSVYLFAH